MRRLQLSLFVLTLASALPLFAGVTDHSNRLTTCPRGYRPYPNGACVAAPRDPYGHQKVIFRDGSREENCRAMGGRIAC